MEDNIFSKIKVALAKTIKEPTPVDMGVEFRRLKPTREDIIKAICFEVVEGWDFGIPVVVDSGSNKVYLGFASDMGNFLHTVELSEIKSDNVAHDIIKTALDSNKCFCISDYDFNQLEDYLKQLIILTNIDRKYNKQSVYVLDFMPKYENNDKYNMLSIIDSYHSLWFYLKSMGLSQMFD